MYYPKSQITTGLYTNGADFVFKGTKEPYTGAYWKTSTNKYYSGKGPSDPQPRELVQRVLDNEANLTTTSEEEPNQTYLTAEALPYANILAGLPRASQNLTPMLPVGVANIPTENDYIVREYRRFFCKKANQELYLEIDQTTFDKLSRQDPSILWQYYKPFDIPWTLVGDMKEVYTTNRNIVQLTIQRNKLTKFAEYLKNDYLKYYRG